MSTTAAPPIPKMADIGRDRQSLLDGLKSEGIPSLDIAIATRFAHEIEADIIELLTRAATQDLDPRSGRLLFRGLHILGGRRLPAGYRALIAFLHAPQKRIDNLLGDVVTETLKKILAGMFDGDPQPLLSLITDPDVDQFVRDAALSAFTFLAFEGGIERAYAEDYLKRFEHDCEAPPGDIIWHTWMTAVALLGFEQMSERVRAAFTDGRIPSDVADERHFRKLLDAALARPDDAQRFADENLGYIEDVIEELERWALHEPDDDTDHGTHDDAGWRSPFDNPLAPWSPRLPARNPWAHVGRNDPCPCGSGKKFKKCCLR